MLLSTILSKKGFSLTETLMAGGILAGMALAGSQLFKNQSKGQKQVETSYEIVNVLQGMRQVLSSVNNCSHTFITKSPLNGTTDELHRFRPTAPPPGFEPVYPKDAVIPGGNIKVLSYTLSKNDIPPATLETFLKVTFSRGKSAVNETSTKMIRLGYTADAGGNILTCWVLNSDVSNFWLQSAVDPDDIFYNGGQVGVGPGMSDPQHTLDIIGDFRVQSGANSVILSGMTLTGTGPIVVSPSMSSPGDMISGGNLQATGNIVSGGNIQATGNVTAGGNLQATGNVTGQNLAVAGAVNAASGAFTGNAQAANFIATTAMQSPSFQYTSDRSLKEKINLLTNPLERVSRLRGVQFSWSESGESDMGFIAQEVELVEPTLVGSGKDNLKTVKYGNVTALLVEAVKELRAEVILLRAKNAELERKVEASRRKK